MPYNRVTIETAVKTKLDNMSSDMQKKFNADPPTAVQPDTTNALIAAAVVEAVDQLVKTADIIINVGTTVAGAGFPTPAGLVPGSITTTAPIMGKIQGEKPK